MRAGAGLTHMTVLRIVLALLVGTGSAGADPATTRIPLGPSKTVEVEPWEPPARVTTMVPGMKGIPSAGVVIRTDPGGDARPWPHGMWIPTPDIGDRNVLELGTDGLPALESTALSARLSRGLDQGVSALFRYLMPPQKLLRKN
jgi:hypothetical protein